MFYPSLFNKSVQQVCTTTLFNKSVQVIVKLARRTGDVGEAASLAWLAWQGKGTDRRPFAK